VTGSLHFVVGSLWGALAGLFVLVGFYNFAHSLRTGVDQHQRAGLPPELSSLPPRSPSCWLGEPLTRYKVRACLARARRGLAAARRTGSRDAAGGARAGFARARARRHVSVGAGNFIYTLGLRAGASPVR